MANKTYPGINIQWPISQEIANGSKVIETRTYPIPEKYINKEMFLIETPGKNSAIKARITAIIKFVSCKEYKNKKEFDKDFSKHLVSKGSEWYWKDKNKWGWEVEVIKVFSPPLLAPTKKGIRYTSSISRKI